MNSLRLWCDADEVRMWLVCLPPGGGTVQQYRPWADLLPKELGVAAIELPAHGSRAEEPPPRSVDALVGEIAEDLKPLLGRPIILFGHSMGAVLALDLARALRSARGWSPTGLVVAASNPPDSPVDRSWAQTDAELTALLRAWGGTSPELLEDGSYLAEAFATLRADLALMAAREQRDEPPLDCPIHIYLGLHDSAIDAAVASSGWARQSLAGSSVRWFPGGHFFVRDCAAEVVAALVDDADAAVGGGLVTPARAA